MSENTVISIFNDFQSQHYVDQLRESKGINVQVFFDTEDVQSMIQGVRSMETNLKIDRNKFNDYRTLVHALAFQKQLGKIHMLPPHQDELANYIKNHTLLPELKNIEYEDLVNDLFHEVGLSSLWKDKKNLSKFQVKQLLEDFRDKAIDLYKANYLIKEPFWNKRIKYLINFASNDKTFLVLNEDDYSLEKTISSPVFKKLHSYFLEMRPDQWRANSNFRDSFALTIIYFKLQNYIRDKSKSIPIFYSTANTIKLINDNKELVKLFSIKINKEGYSFSVLRGEMFFVLDALFTLKDEEEYTELFDSFRDLKKKIGESYDDIVENKDFEDEVNDILSGKFFISFWFEKLVRDQISETIMDLVNYDFIISNQSKDDILLSERNNLSSKLKSNISNLEIIKEVWKSFSRIDKFITKNINKELEEFDVFVDFGLTRFSLLKCDEIQVAINSLISRSQEDKESQEYHLLKSQIITLLIRSLKNVESHIDDLIVPISTLWVFEEYKLIDNILSRLKLDYRNLYQLAVIHAAAIAKGGIQTQRAKKILVCITSKYSSLTNYKPYIGIGFVYYQLWKNKYKPIISKNSSDYIYEKKSEIKKAIDFNEKTYLWLRENKDNSTDDKITANRNRKFYYCLNNKVYFNARSISHYDYIKNSSDIATLEVSYNDGKGVFWQPRFAHTLALAYFRSSSISSNPNDGNTYMKTAKKWIKIAEETMPKSKSDYIKLRELVDQSLK